MTRDQKSKFFAKYLMTKWYEGELTDAQMLQATKLAFVKEWMPSDANTFLRGSTLATYLFKWCMCRGLADDNLNIDGNDELNGKRHGASGFYSATTNSTALAAQVGITNPEFKIVPRDSSHKPIDEITKNPAIETAINFFYDSYLPATPNCFRKQIKQTLFGTKVTLPLHFTPPAPITYGTMFPSINSDGAPLVKKENTGCCGCLPRLFRR